MRLNEAITIEESWPAMFDVHKRQIEDILYTYAAGETTARRAQNQLKAMGYKADLVTNRSSHRIEITDIKTGRIFHVEV